MNGNFSSEIMRPQRIARGYSFLRGTRLLSISINDRYPRYSDYRGKRSDQMIQLSRGLPLVQTRNDNSYIAKALICYPLSFSYNSRLTEISRVPGINRKLVNTILLIANAEHVHSSIPWFLFLNELTILNPIFRLYSFKNSSS